MSPLSPLLCLMMFDVWRVNHCAATTNSMFCWFNQHVLILDSSWISSCFCWLMNHLHLNPPFSSTEKTLPADGWLNPGNPDLCWLYFNINPAQSSISWYIISYWVIMLWIIPKYPPQVSPISASGESSLRCSDAREGFCSSLGVECWPFFGRNLQRFQQQKWWLTGQTWGDFTEISTSGAQCGF